MTSSQNNKKKSSHVCPQGSSSQGVVQAHLPVYSWLESWIQGQILFKKKKTGKDYKTEQIMRLFYLWRRILILFSARTLHMVTWIILLYTFYKNIQSTNTHDPPSGSIRTPDSPFPSSIYIYPSHKSGAVKMYKDKWDLACYCTSI